MTRIAHDLKHHGQTIRRVLTAAGVPIRANGGPTDQTSSDQPGATSDQPDATRQTPWYAVRWETLSPCPGCDAPRCMNPFCCGRRLRALAQHRPRLEGLRRDQAERRTEARHAA